MPPLQRRENGRRLSFLRKQESRVGFCGTVKKDSCKDTGSRVVCRLKRRLATNAGSPIKRRENGRGQASRMKKEKAKTRGLDKNAVTLTGPNGGTLAGESEDDSEGGEGGDDRQKQKDKTLDPRLLMSRMTEGGQASRMTDGGEESEDDRGEGGDDRQKQKDKTLDPLLDWIPD